MKDSRHGMCTQCGCVVPRDYLRMVPTGEDQLLVLRSRRPVHAAAVVRHTDTTELPFDREMPRASVWTVPGPVRVFTVEQHRAVCWRCRGLARPDAEGDGLRARKPIWAPRDLRPRLVKKT